MSEEQRASIHRMYDAFNRRDIDELRRLGGTRRDFEWVSSGEEIDAEARRGTDASMAYFRELFDVFDEVHTSVVEEIELDAERVIFVVDHTVRGAASGARADRREVHLWSFDGDLATSLHEYSSVEEARRAAATDAASA